MTHNRNGQIVTFYSYKGGTGRSMALANVAWILAANGKRVLVVDWDLESPGLFRFFSPFLNQSQLSSTRGVIELIRDYEWATTTPGARADGWLDRYANVQEYCFSLDWTGFPGEGTLDYLSAGQQNHDYAATLAGMNWDEFYQNQNGGKFFDAVRTHMKRHYDYTLIDSRTGHSDIADICTIQLPDVLVDCFTLSEQGIDGAARVARNVADNYRSRRIRILPVPMRVDPAEKKKADAGRTVAMDRFSDLPSGLSEPERQSYWTSVQVPYQAFYGYEESLAAFGDLPGASGTLLYAYESLARHITGAHDLSMPPMEQSVRNQINARFERRPLAVEDVVSLRYAAADEVWAEWIENVLVTAGLRVQSPVGADGPDDAQPINGQPTNAQVITIITQANAMAEGARVLPDHATSKAPLAVYISDMPFLKNIPLSHSSSIAGLGANAAAERLLALVGRPVADVNTLLSGGPRFPGVDATHVGLLARNPRFTGRESDLRELRAGLRAGAAVVLFGAHTVALQGMGGVGKTQLAIEYAHRFRSAYDVIWWVNADSRENIDNSLRELGNQLNVSTDQVGPDHTRAVLQSLGRYRRWLLIFDNADDPRIVGDLIPNSPGHVLITSRDPAWSERARPIQVDVFQRRESIEHLMKRVPSMRPEEANAVAVQLDDLPIAVAAAGAWLADTLTPVAEYLRLIDSDSSDAIIAPSREHAIDKTWDLSLDRLRQRSPAAYRLFQLCSMLAPEIAVELIYSDEMAEWLRPLDPTLSDRMVRGMLVQQINRLALLRLDQHGPAQSRDGGRGNYVLIHRVVQHVVRSRMSAEEQAEARRQVQHVLAAARPREELDDPDSWPRYRMLWPHLDIAGAVTSPDESVRRLLIDRIRYHYLLGDLAAGIERAEAIVETWTGMLDEITEPAEHRTLQIQLLHMRFNMANLLRDLGRFEDARRVDADVLDKQRLLLGATHPHALMTSGSLAGDLRGLGHYREALDSDLTTHAQWLENFGEDYPRTLFALNNVATSHRLMGDFRAARDKDEQVWNRRKAILGETNLYTLFSADCLARDIRDSGEYARSAHMLRQLYQDWVDTRGPGSRAALTAQSNLAISLRSAGEVDEAVRLHDDAYEKLNALLGSTNPQTLSCRLSLALSQLAAGDPVRAARELADLETRYRESLSENHPHTLVCMNNLAMAERVSNRHERARHWATAAVNGLTNVLGADHPYTLSARMNLAICEADAGELGSARELLDIAVNGMSTVLGSEHPNALRAEANLALVEHALGEPAAEAHIGALRERITARVGPHHPIMVALSKQHYLYRIIDPHPF